jgi:hypothetical protein
MEFNFKTLLYDIYSSLREIPLTGKRLRFYAWFSILYPLVLLSGWLGFLIDNIFYRGYLKQKIERPLFIIGNFRSGSTFLQRLIGLDPQFSGMKSWEIYTAPSITMRKFWRGLLRIDGLFGHPMKEALFRWEKRVLKSHNKHPVGIMEYEEDEGLFLFIWAGMVRWFFYPHKKSAENYTYFDTREKKWRRRRFMRFYTRNIRRHLYYRKAAHFFSKNPTSTSKIRSILEWMPDARFVYLARDPYDLIPSNFDLFSYMWAYFSDIPVKYPYAGRILEMVRHYYEYPMEVFRELPQDRYRVVQFQDLVKDPAATVEDIYSHLGYEISEQFRTSLGEKALVSRSHKSTRKIGLSHIGINLDYFSSYYEKALQLFGYPRKVG